MKLLNTFITGCRIRFYHLCQFVRNCIYYYFWHPKFFLVDMATLMLYFWKSPYRMVRLHDEANPENPLGPYGETDFYLFDMLLRKFDIEEEKTIAELGSGRGRLCFWLSMVRKQAKVYGVEQHPTMVERADRVRKKFGIENVHFIEAAWQHLSFSDVDVAYLYVPVESDEELFELGEKMRSLQSGTQIITIGWWFGEVMPDRFELENRMRVRFDWGTTEAYLQRIV